MPTAPEPAHEPGRFADDADLGRQIAADLPPQPRKPAAPNAVQDRIVTSLVALRRDLVRFPDSERYVRVRGFVDDALTIAVEALVEEAD